MAKVNTKVDNKKPGNQRVVLDLTVQEASFLANVVSNVSGSRWDTDVKHAERIGEALLTVTD